MTWGEEAAGRYGSRKKWTRRLQEVVDTSGLDADHGPPNSTFDVRRIPGHTSGGGFLAVWESEAALVDCSPLGDFADRFKFDEIGAGHLEEFEAGDAMITLGLKDQRMVEMVGMEAIEVMEVLDAYIPDMDIGDYLERWCDDPRLRIPRVGEGPRIRDLMATMDPGPDPFMVGKLLHGKAFKDDGYIVAGPNGIVIASAGASGDLIEWIPADQVATAAVETPESAKDVRQIVITTVLGKTFMAMHTAATFEKVSARVHALGASGPTASPNDDWWNQGVAFPDGALEMDYLGGFPGQEGRDKVMVVLDRAGVHVSDPGKVFQWGFDLGWDRVREVAVEGSMATQKRITVTRLLAVGLFALAWKKREQSSFLVLDLDSGEVILSSRRHTVPQLRAELASVVAADSKRRGSDAAATLSTAAPQEDFAEKIRDLAQLRDDGLITEEQFEVKREDLLGRM